MSGIKPNRGGRKKLDDIVEKMAEPGFAASHPRAPSKRSKTGAHVNPEILALSRPKSRYVRRWRRHARHCQDCSNIFRYLGIGL